MDPFSYDSSPPNFLTGIIELFLQHSNIIIEVEKDDKDDDMNVDHFSKPSTVTVKYQDELGTPITEEFEMFAHLVHLCLENLYGFKLNGFLEDDPEMQTTEIHENMPNCYDRQDQVVSFRYKLQYAGKDDTVFIKIMETAPKTATVFLLSHLKDELKQVECPFNSEVFSVIQKSFLSVLQYLHRMVSTYKNSLIDRPKTPPQAAYPPSQAYNNPLITGYPYLHGSICHYCNGKGYIGNMNNMYHHTPGPICGTNTHNLNTTSFMLSGISSNGLPASPLPNLQFHSPPTPQGQSFSQFIQNMGKQNK